MGDQLKVSSMDHVNMKVKSLDGTIKFYGDLFGFQVRKDENPNKTGSPSKIIGNDTVKLCLYEHPTMTPEGGIAHFGLHIENFDDVMDRCRELGVEVLYDGLIEFEGSRSVYIKDPSGYEVELTEKQGGGL
ncbi:methylmalonyl-CoA epimerase/lactoylglutathione lyase [Cenarchaeum symbiosum A]|uniref:Methylmalonyl-CoA epimerase/lactoylglutathione lyase n=1 Tax=Cenarchaeum symbiosum (strain A) TaxID=414004 RepID=A0RX17_CENSY|nr:methylmalonyl-CoA epimerase/lactoylglutathione lyase [Cenarchaeum symbiosum A]